MSSFWTYWYFHIPNFVLAAVQYTLIGRLVLGFFVPDNWDNYIWRFFRLVTDPVMRIVRPITPKLLADKIVLIFCVLWVMMLRLIYLVTLINLGLGPTTG
jgi:uncharacterized protein YggT (Ycf19 family)